MALANPTISGIQKVAGNLVIRKWISGEDGGAIAVCADLSGRERVINLNGQR